MVQSDIWKILYNFHLVVDEQGSWSSCDVTSLVGLEVPEELEQGSESDWVIHFPFETSSWPREPDGPGFCSEFDAAFESHESAIV